MKQYNVYCEGSPKAQTAANVFVGYLTKLNTNFKVKYKFFLFIDYTPVTSLIMILYSQCKGAFIPSRPDRMSPVF